MLSISRVGFFPVLAVALCAAFIFVCTGVLDEGYAEQVRAAEWARGR